MARRPTEAAVEVISYAYPQESVKKSGVKNGKTFQGRWKRKGRGTGEDLLLERVAAVAEDSHLTLDVGVCLRAFCPPNQCQKPLPCDKRSDNSGPGIISENDRITC
jgi:hypothetical protein